MERKKYYVSIKTREISKTKVGDNDDFTVFATDAEIQSLRNKLDHIEGAEMAAYWRAHIPILPYHNDKGNQAYDEQLREALQMVYDLGDKDSRQFIAESGILDNGLH